MRLFDLAGERLARFRLVRLAADEHALVIVVHRTAFDDHSSGVLIGDLAALYRAEVTGERSALAEPAVRFADSRPGSGTGCAARCWPAGAALAGALGGVQTSQFPTDRARPPVAATTAR